MLILGTYRDVEVGRGHPLETTLRELIRERLVEEVHLAGSHWLGLRSWFARN